MDEMERWGGQGRERTPHGSIWGAGGDVKEVWCMIVGDDCVRESQGATPGLAATKQPPKPKSVPLLTSGSCTRMHDGSESSHVHRQKYRSVPRGSVRVAAIDATSAKAPGMPSGVASGAARLGERRERPTREAEGPMAGRVGVRGTGAAASAAEVAPRAGSEPANAGRAGPGPRDVAKFMLAVES